MPGGRNLSSSVQISFPVSWGLQQAEVFGMGGNNLASLSSPRHPHPVVLCPCRWLLSQPSVLALAPYSFAFSHARDNSVVSSLNLLRNVFGSGPPNTYIYKIGLFFSFYKKFRGRQPREVQCFHDVITQVPSILLPHVNLGLLALCIPPNGHRVVATAPAIPASKKERERAKGHMKTLKNCPLKSFPANPMQ